MLAVQKKICQIVFVFTAMLLSCNELVWAQSVPNQFHIDEIAWYNQLATARPDIIDNASIVATTTNPALNALMIRPRFRSLMLKYPNTYGSIMSQYCTASIQQANNNWVTDQQTMETILLNNLLAQFNKLYPNGNGSQFEQWLVPQNIVKPGYYDMNDYVSYWVGPTKTLTDPTTGIDCKIFFTFANPVQAITPYTYYTFAQKLLAAGFCGDFKSQAWSNAVTMNYNDIILHAGSIANAKLAERVGIQYFGNLLTHESRGIDYTTQFDQSLDWHQYLLQYHGKINNLPADIQAFLRYQN